MSTSCSVFMLWWRRPGVPVGKQDGNFKRARHSGRQRVPTLPCSARPQQGQAVSRHRSAPSHSPGSCTQGVQLSSGLSPGPRGQGWTVVAGRQETGDRNVPPVQHNLFLSVCVFWAFGHFGSRAALSGCFRSHVFVDITVCQVMCLFLLSGKILGVLYEMDVWDPATPSICNLSLGKACGPSACCPIQDSRNWCSKSCLGVVFMRASPAGPVPALGGGGDVPCRLCSALSLLDTAAPGVTALLIRWRRLWTASADTGWGDELQCPIN